MYAYVYRLKNSQEKINRHKHSIQRKMKKKGYSEKSLRVIKKYMDLKEYYLVRAFYRRLVTFGYIGEVKPTKKFISMYLRFKPENLFYREFFLGIEYWDLYYSISDESFFYYDKELVFDRTIIGLITKNLEYV